MDEKVECSEDLTNQEIFDLATHKEVPEEVIEQVKTEIITNKQARYFIDKLFSYFEQNDFTEEDLLDLNKIKANYFFTQRRATTRITTYARRCLRRISIIIHYLNYFYI